MAKGVGDKNIMTMILIFLAAGVFVGVVGRSSAESVAYFMLAHIPARFAVAVLFIVSCFVSTAMGTSCGTITLIVPIAVAVAKASGFHLALCIGSVMGGVRRQSLVHLRYDHRRLQHAGLRNEGQIPHKLPHCASGGAGGTGADPRVLAEKRYWRGRDPGIPSAADRPVSAGARWRRGGR